jgi:hypothetical protein
MSQKPGGGIDPDVYPTKLRMEHVSCGYERGDSGGRPRVPMHMTNTLQGVMHHRGGNVS